MAPEPMAACKFCRAKVEPLQDDLFHKRLTRKKYHYYCKNCKKDFIIFGKRLVCDCGYPIKKLRFLDKPGLWQIITELLPWAKKLEVQEDFKEEIETAAIKANAKVGGGLFKIVNRSVELARSRYLRLKELFEKGEPS